MNSFNQNGLSRHIPLIIKQEVRRQSKFGCVVCRRGFYQYEHIDPPFEEATEHEAENICCLCGSCHDAVTRGQFSKEFIKDAYRKVRESPTNQIQPPVGPLDFHDGNAELMIGGILYSPAVHTLLRYHGDDLIRVTPSQIKGEPGSISAVFTDNSGQIILKLEENEWIGSLNTWDIDVVGKRITVRSVKGQIVLQLRLDPPGRIIVERLDMRINDSHLIATEKCYAVGRYLTEENIIWVSASIKILKSSPLGAVIEFTSREDLEQRDILLRGSATELTTIDREIVLNGNVGILIKQYGIAIATLCGRFMLSEFAIGSQSLIDIRRVLLSHPEKLLQFISTGKI